MSDPTPPAATRWTTATTAVRSASTWLATAAGAVAGAVFGAGPIFKSDVDASDWPWWQWLLVVALVAIGSAAVVYVIARLLSLQVPIEITLDKLPPDLRSRIETNELHEYLPGSATNLEEFKQYLQAYANAAISLDAAAQTETNAQRKAALKRRALIQKENRDVFVAKRDELYQLASFELEATRLTPRATKSWLYFGGAAVLAVAAMALFTVVLGSEFDGADEASSTDTPTGGLLLKTPDTGDLWTSLGLQDCEYAPGVVPVFVFSETDTEYSVQTIGVPRNRCALYEFSVPRELVKVITVEPVEATVKTTSDPSDHPMPSQGESLLDPNGEPFGGSGAPSN